MEEVLGTCLERGVKVVANAGGLNPAGLAAKLTELSGRLGLNTSVAYLTGDDLIPVLGDLQAAGHDFVNTDTGVPLAEADLPVVTANAYLGGWGITAALQAGADVVVCPRVTDASLVTGPAAWWHGWRRDDWDALAGAVAAGHVIECGPQATGGNYSFPAEITNRRYPGFPIAEVAEDGSSVITKHDGTGGVVSVGTVTAQLLYEIAEPAYANPDVIARFDTIALDAAGTDRVRVSRVKGLPPPAATKVAINYPGGYRNTMTMVLTGLDIEAKAARAEAMLWEVLGGRGQFASADVRVIRSDQPDARTNEQATAQLRVTVKDPDPTRVGRRFSNAVTELSLASYSGFFTTTPPGNESAYGVYWPTFVPAESVTHTVLLPDGTSQAIAHTSAGQATPALSQPPLTAPMPGPTVRQPLGTVCGARSGDKGGNANIGVWTWDDRIYAWLAAYLDTDRLRTLIPETAGLEVRRYELANLRALNFVIVGLLGEGVASSVRSDPQAKGLGEYLRSRAVDLPQVFAAMLPR
jgi:hypothetical protein